MLNAKAFANAVTTVTVVFYVVCAALAILAPDLIFSISQSWMHSINLESVKATTNPSFGLLIWGLVTLTVLTWVTTYAAIWLYNRWAK